MAIDLKRSIIRSEYGHFTVDANATFEAGQIATYNSDGEVAVCDGTAPMGILKGNKTSGLTGVVVNEAIVLSDTSSVTLAHANVSNVKVKNATTGGTTYVGGGSAYTLDATHGIITRVGTIVNGATSYVTYTYSLSTAELKAAGVNFNLHRDDTAGSGKITVIEGFGTVYTDKYVTDLDYATNDTVYSTNTGLFTKTNSYSKPFGKVVSVPSANDPFLGVEGNFIADR